MRLIDADDLKRQMLILAPEMDMVITLINVMPTIEAEPVRHGKWIYIKGDYDENNNRNCVCSECAAGDSHARGVTVPYCWKCGAKMDLD